MRTVEPTAVRPDARLPRPIALLVVGAIAAATALALAWPALPWSGSERAFVGQSRVGVITRQITVDGTAGREGAPAPDFEWVAPDGSRRSLGSLRPAAVVVNFWATWCVPCKEEMPLLDRAAAAHPDVAFLAVDLDEDGGKIRAFFDELGLTRLEPLLDVGLETARRYGLASVPSTYFVDGGGTIRQVHIGQLDEPTLEDALDRIR